MDRQLFYLLLSTEERDLIHDLLLCINYLGWNHGLQGMYRQQAAIGGEFKEF